ncbi:putative ojoplano protein, partial [Toxoplasma gondii GAB2-2007-GAL-DOM2]
LCSFAAILFLLAFWVRIFIHYFGQWLLLSAFRVPVYQLDVSFVIVYVRYVQDLLTADKEVAVVLAGPLTAYFVFLLMSFLLALSQHSFGRLPSLVYRFVPAYGLAVILAPEVNFAIDVIAGHSSGDAFKLYHLYQLREGNGIVGIILTFLLYAAFTAVALLLA